MRVYLCRGCFARIIMAFNATRDRYRMRNTAFERVFIETVWLMVMTTRFLLSPFVMLYRWQTYSWEEEEEKLYGCLNIVEIFSLRIIADTRVKVESKIWQINNGWRFYSSSWIFNTVSGSRFYPFRSAQVFSSLFLSATRNTNLLFLHLLFCYFSILNFFHFFVSFFFYHVILFFYSRFLLLFIPFSRIFFF